MKQEEFFKLLERRLSVIEDGERRDILDEYRQHIAMKLQEDHITEEEALADFGDVDSFADEILSAYHVRTGAAEPAAKLQVSRIRESVGEFGVKIREFFRSCGRKLSAFFGNCGKKLRSLFHRAPGEKAPKPPREGLPLWKRLLFGIVSLLRTLIRWFFNILFGGTGLLFFAIAAFLLVALGACIVVVTQGYPLVGVTVAVLGMLLCCGSLSILFWRMIRKKEGIDNAQK